MQFITQNKSKSSFIISSNNLLHRLCGQLCLGPVVPRGFILLTPLGGHGRILSILIRGHNLKVAKVLSSKVSYSHISCVFVKAENMVRNKTYNLTYLLTNSFEMSRHLVLVFALPIYICLFLILYILAYPSIIFLEQTYKEGRGWQLETWKLTSTRSEHCGLTVR
jgi:hypothetical protein